MTGQHVSWCYRHEVTTDQKAVIAITELRDRVGAGGKHSGRIKRECRQITSENEGTLRRKEKHVSLFQAHRRLLVVESEPATARDDPKELDFVRCGKRIAQVSPAVKPPDTTDWASATFRMSEKGSEIIFVLSRK
jgi:hypothetical protein